MIIPIDQLFFKGLCYTLTIISTFRATSRIKYMIQNNGTIGVLDGPYIEQPNFTTTSLDDDTVRLWEAVYTFQESVKLRDDDGDDEITEDGIITFKKEDAEMPYSLSPYVTYSSQSVKVKDSNEIQKENQTISIQPLSKRYFYKPSFLSYQNIKQTFSIKTIASYHPIRSIKKILPKFNNEEDDLNLPYHRMKRCKRITIPYTNHTAKITSYAIPIFRELRSRFLGTDASEEYFISKMTSSFKSFSSNSKGAARAGLIFFFSKDGAYLIKQIKKSEAQLLMSILPKYYKYMKRYSKYSLLTRFFGLYHVHMDHDDKEYYFVIMNSIFPVVTHDKNHDFIMERFDLKGSTVGRECSKEERSKKGAKAILKDLDLINEYETKQERQHRSNIKRQKNGFQFGAVAKSSLLFQLRKDVNFLYECDVIDYSLLVGIVPLETRSKRNFWFHRLNKDLLLPSNYRKEETELIFDDDTTILGQKLFSSIFYLVQILSSPSIYMLKQVKSLIEKPLSISTNKIPYYNAEKPTINGGRYSLMYGKRNNQRALYYLGIIDFLQPWTFQKKVEHEMKGLVLGNEKKGKISCIPPKEYADRFLNFMEGNIN